MAGASPRPTIWLCLVFGSPQGRAIRRRCVRRKSEESLRASKTPFGVEKERFSHSQSSFALLRLRLLPPSHIRLAQAKSLPLLTLAVSSPGRARVRPSLAGKPALVFESPSYPKQQKRTPFGVLFYWRRRRDSNSRAGYPTYALSRGASSTCLSTSPYPADCRCRVSLKIIQHILPVVKCFCRSL